jgi:hypothetical protein
VACRTDQRVCPGSAKFHASLTEKLCEAVRRHVELHFPRKDGSNLLDHLEQVEKVSGKELISFPEVPTGSELYFEWFLELLPSCVTPMGHAPLCYNEIEAWSRLSGIRLSFGEAKLLRDMSLAYIKAVADIGR